MYQRSLSQQEVDRAADVLEIDEPERTKMHAFYARERRQDREANIKLLKAIFSVLWKSAVIALIVWAFLQTWEERLPRNNGVETYSAKP